MKRAPRPLAFDRFTLLHRIAVGGTAEIYLAHDPDAQTAHQLVVIKRLKERFHRDRRYVAMFVDEKRAMSRLDHPNIIRMLQYGKVDRHYFISLEHVWGETASTLSSLCAMKKLRFPAGAALYIGAKVAEALEHAHTRRDEQGALSPIIHRDVTLGNVMLSYDGEVKILDFGIAKAEGRLSSTLLGQVKGTLYYLAPEQLGSEAVGPHTDVYQLGVFLYKTLVGHEPFAGDSELQVMEAIAAGKALQPSEQVRSFPKRVEAVILKAMARRAEDRFNSAGELGDALRELMGYAYGVGQERLARMVAILTDDRRQRQEQFLAKLLEGADVDRPARDLFHWAVEESKPTALNVELTAERGVEDGVTAAAAEATLIDVWEAVSGASRVDAG